MKVAKYVGDLLYDYECVVIPGLGGFLTKDRSVSINEVTHSFSPPFRNVHFNVHLRANDGLLVNHVAQQEQIGYKTAKQRVDQFVFQCHNALDAGKKINFKNIGSIYYDSEKNIVFQQDSKINYSSNSFGLSTLVSPAIRRVTDEEKVKKVVKSAIDKKSTRRKPVDRKSKKEEKSIPSSGRKMEANRRKSTFTNNVIFLLVVAFLMGSGYIYMRRDAMSYYFSRYSSHIPFFYSSVNDYLSSNINSTHVAQLSRSTASFFPAILEEDKEPVVIVEPVITNEENPDDMGSSDITIKSDEQPTPGLSDENNEDVIVTDEKTYSDNTTSTEKIENTRPVKVSPTVSNLKANRFFIIAGSFSKESNAKRLVQKLNNQGFEALIADTNKYGMFRVAFLSIDNRKTADMKLLAIRNENNSDAWLLIK